MTAEQIIIQTVKQLPVPTKGHVIYYDELLALTGLEEKDFIIAMQKLSVKYHFYFSTYIDQDTGEVMDNTGQIFDIYKITK
ncbi:hypothetical protein ATX81_03160 [Oenococcus oeni]|uniref:hypothetical protein n=2 Tax=Oenococcus oeni TaxID=1247 RepID=UPI000277B749|nr:hypothetical protein [Oenococcus oeni]EJO02436.1 putative phage protein [Oenococcus oeni AWRIB318]EKP87974.1 putative phage protein [Oenococcus oeni AWRIB202]OIK65131.1 hypothetical protein ATW64_03230 [Oenococcus oeni]OIK72420.1 hypothetical protein ATW71_09745 [Oenococcus oeni]OIK77201.1 hypothetical protein ATW72_03235 [Oenococcus oeni]